MVDACLSQIFVPRHAVSCFLFVVVTSQVRTQPCILVCACIQVKALRKEARTREDKVVREVLKSRDVILATCVGAATYSLRDEEFDLVVIDEAAQVRGCATLFQSRFMLLSSVDRKSLESSLSESEATDAVLRHAYQCRTGVCFRKSQAFQPCRRVTIGAGAFE